MIKSKFLRAVLLFAILCTTVFFICFFYLKYKESILIKLGIETKQSVSPPTTNVFGTLLEGSGVGSPISVDKSNEGIKDIINFIKNAGPLQSSQSESGTSPVVWDYKTSFMWGKIVSKDLTKGTLTLRIFTPSDKSFSETEKEVKVNCTSYVSTILTSMNLNIVERNVNILEKARPVLDGIMAFCLDENCNLIGRNCAIIQDLYNPDVYNPSR